MKWSPVFLLPWAVLLLPACHGGIQGPPPGFHRGMVLGLFSDANGNRYLEDLEEISSLGADSVSFVVGWATPDVRSARIRPTEDLSPSDGRLRRAVRAAHARGMRVMLLPLLYVERLEEGEWRGTLAPADPDAWWEAYGAFLAHYARLAEEEGIEVLSIGSELCSMEGEESRWRDLAAAVRSIYGGQLTYSANWDHLEPGLAWTDLLDLAGMNAYHEVGRRGSSLEALRRSWREVLPGVGAWQSRHGKRVLITEAGYPSRTGGTATPWDYTTAAPVDLWEQARGYRAFQEAWSRVPYLAGTYLYLWYGDGGPEDAGYTPRGKPAAEVLAGWYTGNTNPERNLE